jgi:hypothetical protein
MPARRTGAVGLGIAVALVGAAAAARDTRAGSDGARPPAVQIAAASAGDFRVVLRATKAGSGSAPTAVVSLTTSQRVGGRWERTGAHRLRGPLFWNTVTGPRNVCRLDLRTAGARPRFRPFVVVQLLLTPSLGCGAAQRYDLDGG